MPFYSAKPLGRSYSALQLKDNAETEAAVENVEASTSYAEIKDGLVDKLEKGDMNVNELMLNPFAPMAVLEEGADVGGESPPKPPESSLDLISHAKTKTGVARLAGVLSATLKAKRELMNKLVERKQQDMMGLYDKVASLETTIMLQNQEIDHLKLQLMMVDEQDLDGEKADIQGIIERLTSDFRLRIHELNEKIAGLQKENRLLKDSNAGLKLKFEDELDRGRDARKKQYLDRLTLVHLNLMVQSTRDSHNQLYRTARNLDRNIGNIVKSTKLQIMKAIESANLSRPSTSQRSKRSRERIREIWQGAATAVSGTPQSSVGTPAGIARDEDGEMYREGEGAQWERVDQESDVIALRPCGDNSRATSPNALLSMLRAKHAQSVGGSFSQSFASELAKGHDRMGSDFFATEWEGQSSVTVSLAPLSRESRSESTRGSTRESQITPESQIIYPTPLLTGEQANTQTTSTAVQTDSTGLPFWMVDGMMYPTPAVEDPKGPPVSKAGLAARELGEPKTYRKRGVPELASDMFDFNKGLYDKVLWAPNLSNPRSLHKFEIGKRETTFLDSDNPGHLHSRMGGQLRDYVSLINDTFATLPFRTSQPLDETKSTLKEPERTQERSKATASPVKGRNPSPPRKDLTDGNETMSKSQVSSAPRRPSPGKSSNRKYKVSRMVKTPHQEQPQPKGPEPEQEPDEAQAQAQSMAIIDHLNAKSQEDLRDFVGSFCHKVRGLLTKFHSTPLNNAVATDPNGMLKKLSDEQIRNVLIALYHWLRHAMGAIEVDSPKAPKLPHEDPKKAPAHGRKALAEAVDRLGNQAPAVQSRSLFAGGKLGPPRMPDAASTPEPSADQRMTYVGAL